MCGAVVLGELRSPKYFPIKGNTYLFCLFVILLIFLRLVNMVLSVQFGILLLVSCMLFEYYCWDTCVDLFDLLYTYVFCSLLILQV